MNTEFHYLEDLFAQLNLPNNKEEVEKFIKEHSPLATDMQLEAASFWNSSQKAFIEEAKQADSDWTEVVDHLDAALRRSYL